MEELIESYFTSSHLTSDINSSRLRPVSHISWWQGAGYKHIVNGVLSFRLRKLNTFLHSPEMHIQLMEMLQQRSEWRALGHLGEGIHVLGETLAAIAELAIGTRHVGVRVVDITRKQHARVYLAPVGTHLLAVLAAGVSPRT